MPDIALDAATHDLDLVDGDLYFVTEVEEVIQGIKQNLLLFRGDYYLNINAGIPYYEQILIKNPNSVTVPFLFKQAILNTTGVNEILEFDLDYDTATRKLTVTFRCDTIYGDTGTVGVTI